MKEIKAYIKTHKLPQVIEKLHEIKGLSGVSIFELKQGYGRDRSKKDEVFIVDNTKDYVPHSKLEIVCKDNLVEPIINIIQKTAHTGLREDGKIYISNIEDAIRISTNERGEEAI